ncbi:MAG: DNA repair protein RadC [Alphaproteobacteria bacterium]|nr:DNA repair protein RadC [Alphaproteobacteria bacterium]
MTDTTEEAEQPLYFGHRERLRERFLADEGASMPDYELLELLLTMAIPRRDVKPLAKKLVARFGDISGVLHAPVHELRDVCKLSQNPLVLLKLVAACSLRASGSCFSDNGGPIIAFWDQFEDYCRELMAYKEVEEFRVFLFNDDLRYLGNKLLTTGTINRTAVHPREIIRAAIENKAVKIILAHNHPSGDAKPSDLDKAVTQDIVDAAEMMDIEVFDHVIVTRTEVFSFRNAGYIVDKEKKKKEKEDNPSKK